MPLSGEGGRGLHEERGLADAGIAAQQDHRAAYESAAGHPVEFGDAGGRARRLLGLADEAFQFGLVNEVVPDHELLDTAVAWARKLGAQAPLAVEQIKKISAAGDLDEGIEAEKQAFASVFQTEDAREGIGAFLGKRTPKWSGK